MLEEIKLRNFRGIANLEVSDFRQINIFVGRNSAGKTSLLEAVSLTANPGSAKRLLDLSNWREMSPPTLEQDDALRAFFFNLDIKNSPEIDFVSDGKRQTVKITADIGGRVFTIPEAGKTEDPDSFENADVIRKLNLTHIDADQRQTRATLEVLPNGSRRGMDATNIGVGSFYVHARRATSANETARLLSKLYKQKRENSLLGPMTEIDPRLLSLAPEVQRGGGMVLADIGLPQMLPVNMLGDGFCRALLILTGLSASNSGMVVVDEIDSGLHYSVMLPVWKALAAVQSKQVFCSTHSDEMLLNTLKAFKGMNDILKIYRIERQADNSFQVRSYDYQSYSKATLRGDEIR